MLYGKPMDEPKEELVVVYKANSENIFMILDLLRRQGLNPMVLEPEDITSTYVPGAASLQKISVPLKEKPAAISILRQYEDQSQSKIRQYSKPLKALIVAPVLASCICVLLFGLGIPGLLVIGISLLVYISLALLLTRKKA